MLTLPSVFSAAKAPPLEDSATTPDVITPPVIVFISVPPPKPVPPHAVAFPTAILFVEK